MKPVIYNLSGIRTPLTGIGRYSVELLKASSALSRESIAIQHGRVLEGQALDRELVSLDHPIEAPQEREKKHSHSLRQLIGGIPFSRETYRAIDSFRFKLACHRRIGRNIRHAAIYHDLNYSINQPSAHSVSTVYDLSNITCPSTHPDHRVKHLNRYFKRLHSNNSHIITISHAVKTELRHHYSLPSDRISVTHLAADDHFKPRPAVQCDPFLNAQNVTYKKYVLCVATLEPRKNLPSVIDAYEALDSETQQEFPLVMVGAMGWKSAALERRINRLVKAGVLKHLGFIPQSELPILYAGAAAFVYPSLYEGFGLPLLEAMQSGCACITSNTGALAEVSDGNAIQVDPLQSDDIAHHLNRLLRNPELNTYHVSQGLERAKQFTWAKTAAETAKIYDTL